MEERLYSVYMHIFPNKKLYIGITRNKVDLRWANGKGYKSNEYMTNAIKKYGWENIEHKVLYKGLTKEEAEAKEIELIAKHKSNKKKYGYNLDNGGSCAGKTSEQTKKKIGLKSKEFWTREEYREKQRIAHEGKYPDNTGRKWTEERRIKTSKAMKGRKPWNKGVPCSDETKKKLSAIGKSKKLSEYHKQRLHEGSLKAAKNREKPVICIDTNKKYKSIKQAALENNTYYGNIIKAIKGERKTAGGLRWEYVN